MTSTETIAPLATAPAAGSRRNRVGVILLLAGLWAWAIAGCWDEWADNPMYSYGWFVPPLLVFFAWRRLDEPFAGREPFLASTLPRRPGTIALVAFALAFLVLPVELLRNELPDDRLNNWFLAALAVGSTLWIAAIVGGPRLAVTLAFPIAFFLTAVAWPKRYESPVTVGLQKFVAAVIVEIMHVLGIHATPQGTTIYLRNGPVGIAEACSGVRSLQASLMISLAIGELFFLRWGRRVLLVALCAGVAAFLNLSRTLTLCLITEYRGNEAMEKAHDYIGDGMLLILPVIAWVLGRFLATPSGVVATDPPPKKPAPDAPAPPPSWWQRLRRQESTLDWSRLPNFLPALAVGAVGFLTYHVWLHVLDVRNPPQQAPYFYDRAETDPSIKKETTREDIWAALSPTSGGQFIVPESAAASGFANLYHFFWKPAAANRWVTGHRPDVCMPAGGWEKDGPVEPVEVEFNGHRLRLSAFRFTSPGRRALQLWGIWRNGEPIDMNFFTDYKLEWSLLTGKNRSAVEVVSCVVMYTGQEVPLEAARRALATVFEFRRPDQPATAGAPSTTNATATATASPSTPNPAPGQRP